MFLSGHKTKESYVQDISIISEMIKIVYLNRGIINYGQYENIKDDTHRANLVNAMVERILVGFALWDIRPSYVYEEMYEEELNKYIEAEFKDIPHDPATIKLVLYEADIALEVFNLLPEGFNKATWAVWLSRVVGITLIIQNQGDYRAINYFNDDREHMEKLKEVHPPEVLYQHE